MFFTSKGSHFFVTYVLRGYDMYTMQEAALLMGRFQNQGLEWRLW